MVRRKGVGATVVATAVFSVLILANMEMYQGSAQNVVLAEKAYEEHLLYSRATVGAATQGLSLLERVQTIVGSSTFSCESAREALSAQLDNLSMSSRNASLVVASRIHLVPSEEQPGMYPELRPFDGSVVGELDFRLDSNASDSTIGSDVTLDVNSSHFIHLPVHFDSLVGSCMTYGGEARQFLQGITVNSCSSSSLSTWVAQEVEPLRSEANHTGFGLTFDYSVHYSHGCSVAFVLSVSETLTGGPLGSLSARAGIEESVGVSVLNSTGAA